MQVFAAIELSEIEVLTALLVFLTGYYAWQTQRMAREMQRSRELSVRPKLALDVHLLTPTYGMAQLKNVGQGAALDVDLELTFEPAAGSTNKPETRILQAPILVPGEYHQFAPPDHAYMDEFAASWERVRARGRLKDPLGKRHNVEETTPQLSELWDRTKGADRYFYEDPREKIYREVKSIRGSLEKSAGELRTMKELFATPRRRRTLVRSRQRQLRRRRRRRRWPFARPLRELR